jgi:hypothetical protein
MDTDPTSLYYEQYFGVSHFSSKSYYGGHYASDNNSHYDLITANGVDFIIVYLVWHAPTNLDLGAINWVNTTLQAHPDRRAIVVSHELIHSNGNWSDRGKGVGYQLYETIKGNKNLFMMWCGHFTGEGRKLDVYQGNETYTLLSDYQDYPNGGNGRLKLLTFDPAHDLVKVETYSPYANTWDTGGSSRFTIPFSMGIVDGAVYELEPQCAPGKRLEVAGGGKTDGSNVQIWEDRNRAHQRWRVQKQADGSYELNPDHAANMRLDVSGAGTAAGANVQTATDSDSASQRWILESQTDGYYELVPKHATALRLDVDKAGNANGTNVQLAEDSNGPAQRFKLIVR